NRMVQSIGKRDVLDYLDKIVDDSGGIAANRTLAAIRRFFSWCIERDYIAASPCAGIKDPAEKVSRDRVLSDDEIRWAWKAFEATGYPFGSMGKLLVLTGQRRDEVAGIVQAELNTGGKLWTIPGGRTKNADPHDVPLSDAALAVIEAAQGAKDRVPGAPRFLFSTTGETYVSGYSRAKRIIDAEMAEIVKQETGEAVEIPRWTMHD